MVIDSSAFVAILTGEAEQAIFVAAIAADTTRFASAVTVFETSMVLVGRGGEMGLLDFQTFYRRAGVQTAAFEPGHVEIALSAFSRFGKGRHRARLNFGDCFSYALAKAMGQPLLFKGDDFVHTDIVRAA